MLNGLNGSLQFICSILIQSFIFHVTFQNSPVKNIDLFNLKKLPLCRIR